MATFDVTGSTCMVRFVDVCAQMYVVKNVVDLSIMPFVDFLKEFYPFVNCDIVMHLIW